jgi:hypothetical protein
MPAKVEPLDLENARIESSPLLFEKAEDLLPDIAQIISRGMDQVSPEIAKLAQSGAISKDDPATMLLLLPAVSGVLQQLGGGKLRALAPRVLASTSITLTGESGEKVKYDLVSKDDRAACFDARPDIYFPALWHAGKVTFGRFFPALGRRSQKATPTE